MEKHKWHIHTRACTQIHTQRAYTAVTFKNPQSKMVTTLSRHILLEAENHFSSIISSICITSIHLCILLGKPKYFASIQRGLMVHTASMTLS